jgi:hypothetical protein
MIKVNPHTASAGSFPLLLAWDKPLVASWKVKWTFSGYLADNTSRTAAALLVESW